MGLCSKNITKAALYSQREMDPSVPVLEERFLRKW